MKTVSPSQAAEVLAPTQELRGVLADMRREIEMLRRREAAREAQLHRLKAELDHAAQIQSEISGRLPTLKGAELTVVTHPADRVNGDFHFAQRMAASGVTLAVADATGHGLAAGLIAAALQGAMGHAERAASTEVETLQKLNDQLLSYEFADCEFVTAVLATYNEQTRMFRWARAGGPPPVLIRESERPRRLMSGGMPLGVEADCEFGFAEILLEPGDLLLLHTDGLEALHTRMSGSQCDQEFLRWIATRAPTLTKSIGACRAQDDITAMVLHLDRT